MEGTLETSKEDLKLHSKRVRKIENYTRFECICSFVRHLAEAASELPSLRKKSFTNGLNESVPTILAAVHKYTSSPLVSSVVLHLSRSFRVWFRVWFYISSPLVSSVVLHLFHSFRVCFMFLSIHPNNHLVCEEAVLMFGSLASPGCLGK
jgi:hypothetical protein